MAEQVRDDKVTLTKLQYSGCLTLYSGFDEKRAYNGSDSHRQGLRRNATHITKHKDNFLLYRVV